MKVTKVFSVIHYIHAVILWILAMLTLLFNLLGKWVPWNLAGFGTCFFAFPTAVSALPAIVLSAIFSRSSKKHLILNCIALLISIAMFVLLLTVFQRWFW